MEIKYRSHAVNRMLQKKISTDEVALILKEPDGVIAQSLDKFIFYKKLKKRRDNLISAVTLIKSKETFEVLTVMIDFEVQQ